MLNFFLGSYKQKQLLGCKLSLKEKPELLKSQNGLEIPTVEGTFNSNIFRVW